MRNYYYMILKTTSLEIQKKKNSLFILIDFVTYNFSLSFYIQIFHTGSPKLKKEDILSNLT